ncbi:hypothetical protein [Nocardiopsis lambiniae]|uniref:DUF423 domain-containing protein n=1 Tax=Nocardiopsis lambiniae TaxID=3075539 RepID=A0ABU2MCS7_9ACTN|nr:hypothetical protein [Nocardiopsis sp. DSM 44743]MDT0330388.1 hypothetical protein [Nocardiopsis sp. DSM 44743]
MDRTTTTTTTPTPLWAVRVAVLAHLAAILWEGATAGQLVTFNHDALSPHYFGAFGVHAMAALQVLTALWYWNSAGRGAGAPRALLLVSASAFLVGFPQAALGTYGPLQAHVPLALVLTGLAVWSAVLAWRRP